MLFRTSGSKSKSIYVTMQIHNKELQLEVDTGASSSVISEQTYHKLWSNPPHLTETSAKLCTYMREQIKILGFIQVVVEYQKQKETLNLLVVSGSGTTLMGRDWLDKIKLNWGEMLNNIHTPPAELQEVLDEHRTVLKDELGLITNHGKNLHRRTSRTKVLPSQNRAVRIEREGKPRN